MESKNKTHTHTNQSMRGKNEISTFLFILFVHKFIIYTNNDDNVGKNICTL